MDTDGKLFGNYQFKLDGPSLQYFSAVVSNHLSSFNSTNNTNYIILKGTDNIFSIVELRIESNHGHEEYTCLYRIRVHGELA